MTLACCQVVNNLISWLDRTLQFSKCEVEEENLKLENQDVFIHLPILSIRMDLYDLEVHKKKHKNHRHGGILPWICGLPFKTPGKLHTQLSSFKFSPCSLSRALEPPVCLEPSMQIGSNPLNFSWWFPLIFPPRFPKSSLRILKGSPVICGSGSFHSLSRNLACTGSKKTATYRASQFHSHLKALKDRFLFASLNVLSDVFSWEFFWKKWQKTLSREFLRN